MTRLLVVVVGLSACALFDDAVYCDDKTRCPDARVCDANLGTCRALGASEGEGEGDAPPAPQVQLLPQQPRTDDTLVLSVPNAGADLVQVRWTRNATAVDALDDSLAVDAALTSKGQVWRAQVTLLRGVVPSETATAQVTIVDTAAVIGGLRVHPLRPKVGDALTASVVVHDVDGDTAAVVYNWTAHAGGAATPLTLHTATLAAQDIPPGTQSITLTADVTINAQPVSVELACPRTIDPGPRWDLVLPVALGRDLLPGTRALDYDAANDRVLVTGLDESGIDFWELRTTADGPVFEAATAVFDDSALFGASLFQAVDVSVSSSAGSRRVRMGGVTEEGVLSPRSFVLDTRHGCETAWREITANGDATLALGLSSAAYDPLHERIITFGGADGAGAALPAQTGAMSVVDEAEVYSHIAVAGFLPSARALAPMFFDATFARIVMFGGTTAVSDDGLLGSSDVAMFDVNADTWTAYSVVQPMPFRYGAGHVLLPPKVGAPARDVAHLIEVGGCATSGACKVTPLPPAHVNALRLAQTEGAWSEVVVDDTAQLLGTFVFDATYDSARDRVLFLAAEGDRGFRVVALVFADDMRTAATSLVFSTVQHLPAPRSHMTLAYVPGQGRGSLVTMMGQVPATTTYNADAWEFRLDTRQWRPITLAGAVPVPRASLFTAIAGGTTDDIVPPWAMVGGACPGACNEAFTIEFAAQSPSDSLLTFTAIAPLPIGVDGVVLMVGPRALGGFDGSDVTTQDVSFNGSAWVANPGVPSASAFGAGATAGFPYYFGGQDATSGVIHAVTQQDGLSYFEVGPTPALIALQGASLSTVSAVSPQGRMLLFGGANEAGDASDQFVALDCPGNHSACVASTLVLSSTLIPAPRAFHAARYDPASQTLFVFGGEHRQRPDLSLGQQLWTFGPIE